MQKTVEKVVSPFNNFQTFYHLGTSMGYRLL